MGTQISLTNTSEDICMTWFTRHATVRRDGGLPDLSDLETFFDAVFPVTGAPTTVGKTDLGFPKTNVIEHDGKFIVELGLAGWKKDELHLEVLGDNLVVSGESKESSTQGGQYLRRELKRSKFSKTITLGKDLDRDNIEATYEDGLLVVTIPKLQKSAPRSTTISIK